MWLWGVIKLVIFVTDDLTADLRVSFSTTLGYSTPYFSKFSLPTFLKLSVFSFLSTNLCYVSIIFNYHGAKGVDLVATVLMALLTLDKLIELSSTFWPFLISSSIKFLAATLIPLVLPCTNVIRSGITKKKKKIHIKC